MLSTRSKAHDVATREYDRLMRERDKAINDSDRARRAAAKAFDCMSDPATVEMRISRALMPDETPTSDQSHAIASWENARSRVAGISKGLDALGKVLRQLDDEEVGR